jgi:hypothetical protein
VAGATVGTLEGLLLCVEYGFAAYNLHKLYFESLASEAHQYGSLVGPILRQEAHLVDHRWVFGHLEDCYIFALHAADVPRLLDLLPSARTVEPPRSAQRSQAVVEIEPVVVEAPR